MILNRLFKLAKFRITISLLGVSLAINAQQTQVTLGAEDRIDSRNRIFSYLGNDSSQFYIQRIGSAGTWTLEAYSLDSLKMASEVEVIAPSLGDGETELLETIQIGGQFIMLHALRLKSNGKRQLYLTPVNLNGQALDLPVYAGEIPALKRRDDLFFGIACSPDSSKFGLYFSIHSAPYEEMAFGLRVFSSALVLLQSKELALPYTSELLNIDKMLIDNRGQFYMLSGMLPEKTANTTPDLQTRNKRYLLFSYDFTRNKLKEFDVNLKDKWVVGVSFGIAPTGILSIGGFYSNDMYFSIAGSFFFSIDTENWSIVSKTMKPFEKDFLREFGNSRLDAGGRELFNYYFDHFILKPNGSAFFVAEQYYVEQRWMMDPGTGRQSVSYAYNYNDLIVVNVDTSGQIGWTARVPKRQLTLNDGGPYSSYALSYNDQTLDIIFNDNPRNYEPGQDELQDSPASFGSLKKSLVTWARVDSQGQLKRTPLFSAKESETVVRPKISFQTNNAELIVYSELRKEFRHIKIRFPVELE